MKEARINAGKTVLETAHALNVSPQAVYQWERGETVPKAQKLVNMAGLYGCSVEKLLTKESEVKTNTPPKQDST